MSHKTSTHQKTLGIYHDLDQFAGTWTEADENEFLEATADFEKIDEEIWN